ncbi:MAG: baseplate J/gp47 family protein [Clostridium sp.]
MIGEHLEKYTFDYLIKSALEKVPDDIDKRQGSIIYDALAPACYQLADMYMTMRSVILDTYIMTSYGEYLDNKVIEQGLSRYDSTKALKKGTFTFQDGTPATLQKGSRFSTVNTTENLIYKIIDEVQIDNRKIVGEYILECEKGGTAGNSYMGDLLPVTYISNLKSCKLSTLISPARDKESDEDLRTRYLLAVNQKPFGGNCAQYNQELIDLDGVAAAQVYPTWNGGGTVKCSIIDSDYKPVTGEFLEYVQNLVDPEENTGGGLGLAPIGHKVTVTTPSVVTININADINLLTGYILEQVDNQIKSSIDEYLKSLRKNWGISDDYNKYSLSIYTSQITASILKVTGVANASNIRINGKDKDLILREDGEVQELPMLGEVVFN